MRAASGEVMEEMREALAAAKPLTEARLAGLRVASRLQVVGDRLRRSSWPVQVLDNQIDSGRAISADDRPRPH